MVTGVVTIACEQQPQSPSLARSTGAPATGLREFIAGPENRLAPVAVDDLLSPSPLYQPLVLYGPTGSGKTLLASGMTARWQAQHPQQPAHCATGADFAREYAMAQRSPSSTSEVRTLRKQFSTAPLLWIDDLDSLAGRSTPQDELIRILDQRTAKQRPSIFSLRRAPTATQRMQPALASRLSGGLVVPLALPGEAARRVILDRLAELHSIQIPARVAELLCVSLAVPAQQLRSALLELTNLARTKNQPINETLAREVIQQLRGPQLSLGQIAVATGRLMGVKLSDLRGPTRRQSIVRARGVAILLCRELTNSSLSQIGGHFGKRDHTTVLHACRKTEEMSRTDAEVRSALSELRNLLEGS